MYGALPSTLPDAATLYSKLEEIRKADTSSETLAPEF